MSFRSLLIPFFLLVYIHASAQVTDEEYIDTTAVVTTPNEKDRIRWADRLVYGGNLGLWIGTSSYVQVNPMVGVKLTDWCAAGVGGNYTYLGNRVQNISYYGPSVWTRLRPLNGFYLHTEYNLLRASYYDGNIPVWLVGAGYVSPGEFASIGIFLMYDVIQHEYSPYRGLIMPQGGLLIGF